MDIDLFDTSIEFSLKRNGWDRSTDEGRLMLAELIIKAAAGYANSHTEEALLSDCNVLTKERIPMKYASRWLCSMCYAHSNGRSEFHRLSEIYRTQPNK